MGGAFADDGMLADTLFGGVNRMRWIQFLFSFEGRVTRRDYWLRLALPVLLIGLVAALTVPPLAFNEVFLVLILAAAFPCIAVAAKRCHDRNRSGWFLLICLIPMLGILWLLIELGFFRGTIGPNRFGPDAYVQRSTVPTASFPP